MLLTNFKGAWLAPEKWMEMARVVHAEGAALDNVSGFFYGTVRSLF